MRAYIRWMMNYALFETAIGWTGLVWGAQGLTGVHLPEGDPDSARRGLLRRFPEAIEVPAPDSLLPVIDGIRALLSGEHVDLSDAPLDIARVPPFNAQVYAIAQAIPAGETLTYGEIAARLGDRLLARDVGAAMGQNPWPIVVPCHRVTAAGGKLGGFSARGGAHTKLKLLTIEGAAPASQADPPASKDPGAAQLRLL